MEFTNFKNIHEMLKKTVDSHSDKDAYRWFLGPDKQIESVTWKEFYKHMAKLST